MHKGITPVRLILETHYISLRNKKKPSYVFILTRHAIFQGSLRAEGLELFHAYRLARSPKDVLQIFGTLPLNSRIRSVWSVLQAHSNICHHASYTCLLNSTVCFLWTTYLGRKKKPQREIPYTLIANVGRNLAF